MHRPPTATGPVAHSLPSIDPCSADTPTWLQADTTPAGIRAAALLTLVVLGAIAVQAHHHGTSTSNAIDAAEDSGSLAENARTATGEDQA